MKSKKSTILICLLLFAMRSVLNEELNEQSLQTTQSPLSEINSSTETTLDQNQKSICEKYNFDCEGCLKNDNCVYCWAENVCAIQNHEIVHQNDTTLKDNTTIKDDSGFIPGVITEKEARIRNNNTILVQQLGTLKKNTCPKINTLNNISLSSCSINELTLLYLMFTSIILSVIVLFGCLFYCCVCKKTGEMIIIASDKDNFVLIDED